MSCGQKATCGTPQPSFFFRSLPLIAEIAEAQPNLEVLAPAKGDHGLEFVATFPGHSHLTILKGALDLQTLLLDRFDDLLGFISVETLLDDQLLRRVAERRNRRILAIDVPQVDPAL